MRTWHKEALVVGTILATVAILRVIYFNGQSIELLGALAVFFTFQHASIAFRMQESEERKTIAEVSCHYKAQRYFLMKETCWFIYFSYLGAWSALVGVIIFLLYPMWRRYHVGQRKMTTSK